MQADVQALIEKLNLSPHPEGGWFRETWRSERRVGERAIGTAILFLLEAGQRSAWHQVDAEEFWLWHAGAPLRLQMADKHGVAAKLVTLGPDVLIDQAPQVRIPAHDWQSAHARDGWALVSCLVAPGFEFAGFKLAAADWTAKLDRLLG
jgi:predicted cupin superfamily sugar epimerase